MRVLLTARDVLSRFYGQYDTIIRLTCKFVLALTAFASINQALGQTAILNNLLILVGLAVICTFLPSNSILLIGAALILGHFYGISLEAAVVGGGLLVIGILLYFGISPDSALPLILTALAQPIGLGCAPALVFGLIGGPLSAVGAAFGALTYYLIRVVAANGGALKASAADAAEAMVQKIAMMIDYVITDKEMLIAAGALAAVLLIVYLIRIMEIKYAWNVAIAVGAAAYVAIYAAAAAGQQLSVNWLWFLTGTLVSVMIAWLVQIMLFSLDYRRTENVRFEDDEYFYYVKAVPKKKVLRKKRKRRAEGR